MHGGLYLARNALVTVGEADHPRSLAHPQHNDRGQHLHTHTHTSGTLLRALTADDVFENITSPVGETNKTYLSKSDAY